MVPGLNEVDCRIAEFRLHEMHAESERRRAAIATIAPRQRIGVFDAIRTRMGTMMTRMHATMPRGHSFDAVSAGMNPVLGVVIAIGRKRAPRFQGVAPR